MASARMVLTATFACVLMLCLHDASGQGNGCPTICTAEFAPVCGRRADGTTREFPNNCSLRVHQCNNPGDIVSSERGRCA